MSKIYRAASVALLLALVGFVPLAHAAGRGECNSLPSKVLARAVPYCVLLPPSYDTDKEKRYPVLFFFHGLGDDEQMFLHSGGINLVEDLWEDHQLGEFLIVTPAGWTTFYINSRDGRHRYEDFFLQEFMPGIEKRYRTETDRANRGIGGVSMGGYGALHIAFQHPDLFAAVAVNSAALLEKLPKVGGLDSEIFPQLRVLSSAFGSPLDAAFWNKNDPVTLAKTANLSGLKIYFDCGYQDDYDFELGAMALDKVLKTRQIPHKFELYQGGHGWTYFAAHLPGSLEFESKAFGLAPTAADSSSR